MTGDLGRISISLPPEAIEAIADAVAARLTLAAERDWYTIDDLAEIRRCSVSHLQHHAELLPDHGVPGRRRPRLMWARPAVDRWRHRSDEDLREEWERLRPADRQAIIARRRAA